MIRLDYAQPIRTSSHEMTTTQKIISAIVLISTALIIAAAITG
jgi:hypothetical protein